MAKIDPLSGFEHGGAFAVGIYVLVVSGGFGLLFSRYREAEV